MVTQDPKGMFLLFCTSIRGGPSPKDVGWGLEEGLLKLMKYLGNGYKEGLM